MTGPAKTDASQTDATGADTTGADGAGADTTGADATGADGAGADGAGADTTGADTTGAFTTGVDGAGAGLPEPVAGKTGVAKTGAPKAGPIKSRLLALQDRLSQAYGTDISTPDARRAAWWHFHLMDHAFLRVFWTNLDLIAPGVWRANQPSQGRLKQYFRNLGLKSVVNLRGAPDQGFYLFEVEACRDLGLTLHDVALSARRAPPRAVLIEVLDLLQTVQKPVLIHCKSGADRTGLVAALYLLTVEHQTLAQARRHLSLRYLHVKASYTGILDHLLDRFEAEAQGRTFRAWVLQDYDPDRLADSFATLRKE